VLPQNMEGIAQSWLVLELTNSPLLLGLTGLTFAIPTITLTLLSGAIAEYAGAPAAVVVGGAFVAVMSLGIAMCSPNMRRLEQ